MIVNSSTRKDEVEKMIEELEHDFIDTKSKTLIPLEIMVVLGKVQGIVGSTYTNKRIVLMVVPV